MKLKALIIILISLCFNLLVHCQLIIEDQDASTFNLEGKWQSLNNRDYVVEFSGEDEYTVYNQLDVLFKFKYKTEEQEGGLISLEIYIPKLDTDSEVYVVGSEGPQRATIQIVNQDRMRIYYWKHKEILDLADEYSRTEDLNSFSKLIKKAIK